MHARVTAILVARNGAKHLERTLEALSRQTRQPDVVITVDCGSSDATAQLLAAHGPTHFISADSDLTFGQAIAAAVRVMAPPESDSEMLWLLAQDSAPEPGALEALLGELEIAPSVAVAGPKIMDWRAHDYIHDVGLSMTPGGATVTLVESELDQGQHDGMSDVLAVDAGGMLVRHSVWNQLGGFDPGLPSADDALDFCVRVRLSGRRVSVVAAARVASAGDGVAGLSGSSRGRARRKRLRVARTAQLHRRLVYSAGWLIPLHWIALVPFAFFRSIGALLQKEPGAIPGEFSAAFRTAFSGSRVHNARRRLAETRTLGWGSIASLRLTNAEVRRRHALKREAVLVGIGADRPEIRFFASGGAWTVLAAALVGIIMFASLLGAQNLAGGGLLPLSSTPAGLWASVGYGWRDLGLGFVGAADPFAAVLAVLGSLTFWAPSYSLVLLYFVALPLAALGAWLAATRLTDRGLLRFTAAALWVLAPTFLTAFSAGHPAAILAHLLLPWLFFAGYSAGRSWSASATASLLFAAVLFCAPSLTPALLILWLLCSVASGRGIARFIGIPLPAVALALPLILDQGLRGSWLALLADPGVPVPSTPAPDWQLLLGFPTGDFGGWSTLLGQAPALQGLPLSWIIPVLFAPLAILAALSLFLPSIRSASVAVLTALLGAGTAIAATQLSLATTGAASVSIWPGSGLSLYWLGLVGAVIFALREFRRFAVAPAVAATVLLAVAVVPLAGALPLELSAVHEGSDRTQPAFVTAEAQTDARVGTLEIVPQSNGGILATIVRGAGTTLNEQSTLVNTTTTLSAADKELATLAGNLASRSGLDASAGLADLGIRFVLLRPAALTDTGRGTAAASVAATETLARATTALDGEAALVPVGDTAYGRLWRHDGPASAAGVTASEVPAHAGGVFSLAALLLAAITIGSALLLSIPTGAGPEAVRQANRDAMRRSARSDTQDRKAEARDLHREERSAKSEARSARSEARAALRRSVKAGAIVPAEGTPAAQAIESAAAAEAAEAAEAGELAAAVELAHAAERERSSDLALTSGHGHETEDGPADVTAGEIAEHVAPSTAPQKEPAASPREEKATDPVEPADRPSGQEDPNNAR
ncbi:glycosyltransferase [Cryobacterium sp. 10C2]|uniref:glycosyltransferase n=1 Tax=Cryobacterium sp. 10C2 TaxID=3048576 RepID=UPI002AB47EB3|nr:glycosyltransferase [Cryobacterium sp. 10C2]MDY7526695.1 glycosyltransferase [Cryobacterium sp. 10C2]MEB0291484.1 glycosyltransferase [Cryobacterium sp. 10C2]